METQATIDEEGWPTAAMKAVSVAQAEALRTQAAKSGLRFEAYLPPGLAEWLIDRIIQGVFLDPSEAVFVILGEHKDLEPHADLRRELLKRILQAAMDDPRPGIDGEEFFEKLRKEQAQPRPEPASWQSKKTS